jgi:hypothetical protein
MKSISLFLLLFITSDYPKNKVKFFLDIELSIKNKEIFYADINPNQGFYADSTTRKMAYNLVELEFKNVTNKKLLLFLDPFKIHFFSINDESNNRYCGHSYMIYNKNEALMAYPIFVSFTDYPAGLDNLYNFNKKAQKEKYDYMQLSDNERLAYSLYENNSFVLNPNEIRTIFYPITLPIVNEIESSIIEGANYFPNLKEGYDFKFIYEANSKNIYNDLPDFVKEELRNNKIEVFDGKIVSNAVKLKKR